jgi:hypothetical protein
MANNLFISYDLFNPGQKYEEVAGAIQSLGPWAKVQKSFWYVKSNFSAEQVAAKVWAVMDGNDSLIVVDTGNSEARWYNLAPEVAELIQSQWSL